MNFTSVPGVQLLRKGKHGAYKAWRSHDLTLKSFLLRMRRRVRPFAFDKSRYPTEFISIDKTPTQPPQEHVPHVIWCAWTGSNAPSENRLRGLDSIKKFNPGAEVILVTPDNINDFLVDGFPVHPIYEYLSLVHRSDYLRSYLLHHHGGAYTDLKTQRGSLSDALDLLNASADLWVVGGAIPGLPRRIPGESPLERDCRLNFDVVALGGSIAVRAGTPLTLEWRTEVERRCDALFAATKRHPGGIWGGRPGDMSVEYPIAWNEIQACVFEPLCLKFADHIMVDDRFTPVLVGHR